MFVSGGLDLAFADFTVAGLTDKRRFDLKTAGGEDGGIVLFNHFAMIEIPSFVEVLRSGMQLSMVIGIDYTASNGNIGEPNSLHALNEHN